MASTITESIKSNGFVVRNSKSKAKQSIFVEQLNGGTVVKNQIELIIAEIEQHALTLPENYKSPKVFQRASHCVEVVF